MNASPAGDTLPVLLALDAALVVGGPRGERTIPAADVLAGLPEDRARGRTSSWSASGSRSPRAGARRFRKVGTRRAQAISKVVMALSWRRGPGAGATSGSRSGRSPRPRSAPVPPRPPSRAHRPTPETADRAVAALARRAAADRRRPVHRRLSAGGRRPDPAAHARGRDMSELGANHYGKDDDPPRQGRQGVGPPRGPRPDRRCRALGRVRGLIRRRRQRDGDRHRHDEEHRLRVRAGAPGRGDRVVRDRARAALRRRGPGVEREGLDPRACAGRHLVDPGGAARRTRSSGAGPRRARQWSSRATAGRR